MKTTKPLKPITTRLTHKEWAKFEPRDKYAILSSLRGPDTQSDTALHDMANRLKWTSTSVIRWRLHRVLDFDGQSNIIPGICSKQDGQIHLPKAWAKQYDDKFNNSSGVWAHFVDHILRAARLLRIPVVYDLNNQAEPEETHDATH